MKKKCHVFALFIFFWSFSVFSNANAFDLDNDNAADLIASSVISPIYQSVSPSAGDATLVLRVTTLTSNAWFDAIAPYHETAVGIYSNLDRRPTNESDTNRNLNIAMFYASYRVLNSLLPQHAADWNGLMLFVGLDPTDTSEDTTTAIGIGNVAGNSIVAARENDGMNQLGNEGGRTHNPTPYADYLGYKPVNTAYELNDPSHWQPAMIRQGAGLYRVQQFVTPQLSVTEPYSYPKHKRFRSPPPRKSNANNYWLYKRQVDEVLNVSANITDEQKMSSELFDNKILSLGLSSVIAAKSNGLSLVEYVHYEFLANVASFDTAIAIWKEKRRHDAVRPFSAIAHIYGDQPVTAWGGVGKGTVGNLPANQWTSYMPVADHPEYPSASASFCAAHAEVSRRFIGHDNLGLRLPIPAGSSSIEPGVTPATDIILQFDTWTDFENKCGESRLWAGVHFPASIPAGQKIGKRVANLAYKFVMKHIEGKTVN